MFKNSYHPSLFDDCATHCEAYAECGGHRTTMPCGCAWTIESNKRYRCDKCYLICRERRTGDMTQPITDEAAFHAAIEEGYSLSQVALSQSALSPPSFIPSYTDGCEKMLSDLEWAAPTIRSLFNARKRGSAELKSCCSSSDTLRRALKVGPECKLIAVLNGTDWQLESIWGMQRRDALRRLAEIGFLAATGPSFSVTALTTAGTLVPYAHHCAMLTRHHRVLAEIQEAGLCAIPNLYWIDGDTRQHNQWSTWLRNNPGVSMISRELTCTRDWQTVQHKLEGLLLILENAGRSFHVLIVGTGLANAPKCVRMIRAAGHRVSIITSAPIIKAIRGYMYLADGHGGLTEKKCADLSLSKGELSAVNLKQFETLLDA